MTHLLDGNVLVALTIDTHLLHQAAHTWFAKKQGAFATCTITQGTLLRVHMALAKDKGAAAAWQTLARISRLPRHVFWDDGFSFIDVEHGYLQGAKQVTDAWLAELARRRKAKVATFDRPFAARQPTLCELIAFSPDQI